MSTIAQYKAVVQRFYTEVWNQGKLDVLTELLHPGVVSHERNGPDVEGIEHEQRVASAFRTAFPDCHFTIEALVAEADKVVAHLTIQATFSGPWYDLVPTNQRFMITGMVLYRFAEGKIIESWSNWDELGLRRQLGDS